MSSAASDGARGARALRQEAERFVGISVGACSLMAGLKIAVGIFSGSQALLVGALYSVNDVLSALAIAVSLRYGYRRPTSHFPFGYGKAEYVAVGIVSVFIAVSASFLVGYSLLSLVEGERAPPHLLAAGLAALSAATCWTLTREALRLGAALESPALETSAEHFRSDASGSAAAILGVAGAAVGFNALDPAVAIFEELHLLVLSVSLLRRAAQGLMDAGMPPEDLELLETACLGVAGVERVESIRSRSHGRSLWVDVAVAVSGSTQVGQAHQIRQALVEAVRNLLGPGTTTQVRIQGPHLRIEPPGPGGSQHGP